MGKVVNSGVQELSLQIPGCVHQSVAIHEFLHALGIAHEHARPDRDNYVRVYFENVQPGKTKVKKTFCQMYTQFSDRYGICF